MPCQLAKVLFENLPSFSSLACLKNTLPPSYPHETLLTHRYLLYGKTEHSQEYIRHDRTPKTPRSQLRPVKRLPAQAEAELAAAGRLLWPPSESWTQIGLARLSPAGGAQVQADLRGLLETRFHGNALLVVAFTSFFSK